MSQLQLSCKITNSLFSHFEKEGHSITTLLESVDEPEEFLRNPFYWIPASAVESIFERASRAISEPLLADHVGRRVSDLQSWGALDSALRLIERPEDFFGNLSKFFSYFLMAGSSYTELSRTQDSVTFLFPFLRETYPHTFDFLRAALETLPTYGGHQAARAEWDSSNRHMCIVWNFGQGSLFDAVEEAPGKMLNPKIVQNLVSSLEQNERLLQERTRELALKNQEIEKLRAASQRQLREQVYTEKMSGLAQLAAGVAHEINNPLAYVVANIKRFRDYFIALQTYIDALELEVGPLTQKKTALDIDFLLKEIPQMLQESQDGLERVKEIVLDLSSLAHPRANRDEKKIPTNLNMLLESSLKVFTDKLGQNIRVEREFHLEQPVAVFPVRMGQVFMNLINNAIQAIADNGTIKVVTKADLRRAYVEILDTGTGMDEDTLSHLFTPFFTTKEVGKGMGLGLSIAQSIVEMHKGRIDIESQKGQGTCVTVVLPLDSQEGEAHA